MAIQAGLGDDDADLLLGLGGGHRTHWHPCRFASGDAESWFGLERLSR
jgi:hypothetical protein